MSVFIIIILKSVLIGLVTVTVISCGGQGEKDRRVVRVGVGDGGRFAI